MVLKRPNLDDFDFNLPQELIAQFPSSERSNSRLLCLDKNTGRVEHKIFKDLPELLTEKDLLVFNNTRVIPARLYATKKTGGKAEIFIERALENNRLLAQIKTSKALKVGTELFLDIDTWFEVIGRKDSFFELFLKSPHSFGDVLKKFGHTPLPPYIEHKPDISDIDRYQTIYAKHDGAVAAPTAGLHFDRKLMHALYKKKIKIAFLTLHVGYGTFQPVRVERIEDHKIHKEYINIPEKICEQVRNTKNNGGRIIAVGTTSVRALETVWQDGKIKPYSGDTDIFIYPGYKFRCIDGMITNFHLPKTSLLMLLCAFAGLENTMHAYQEAIKDKYRFYSYGDGMLII
jgi:S-adenosylmethionine:tRNA ribosyltransferase-isomerase